MVYLTIIPQVWIGYEGERNNCFSKIQLVGQKNIETKHLSQVKAGHQSFFAAKTLQISLLVGYNIIILRILQSDSFQERAVFPYLLTTVMVTNCAKCRVKLRIERAKFQFVLIVLCNRVVLLFNFLIKKQWILTKAITVKANFITQTQRIKRTMLRKLNQASPSSSFS